MPKLINGIVSINQAETEVRTFWQKFEHLAYNEDAALGELLCPILV